MNENENAAGDKSFNWNKQRKRFGPVCFVPSTLIRNDETY